MNQRNVDVFKEKTGRARNRMKRKRGRGGILRPARKQQDHLK
jgi:hypothetical protein